MLLLLITSIIRTDQLITVLLSINIKNNDILFLNGLTIYYLFSIEFP